MLLNHEMRIIFFILLLTPTFAFANVCTHYLGSTRSNIEITDTESFFAAMTRGLQLGTGQDNLFEFYRTRFGNPQTGVAGKTLSSVHSILAKHPELAKLPFREQILERVVRVYNPTSDQKIFIQGQLRSSGQIKSNLFQIDANLGFWKKLIPSDDPALFNRILSIIANSESREILKNTNSESAVANSKALFHTLRHYRRWLQTQPNSSKYLEKANQAMVDLVHVVGFFNKSLVEQLKTPDALLQIQAYRKILDARDEMAMALGYDEHFLGLLNDLLIRTPTGMDPALTQRNPVTNEERLTQKLAEFEARAVESGDFEIKSTEAIRIRILSIIEAPFRGCLGGSDCSTRTYFSKALDPNFYYFTMTDQQHYSSGHITVVLGKAKDKSGQERQIAFIDKIQNIGNEILPVFLEGLRRSLLEKDYELALPQDVGHHNGLSNVEGTRSFVRSELIPSYEESLTEFVPHPHSYNFENNYSRAYDRLAVVVVKPIELSEDIHFLPGEFYPSRAAPADLDIKTLLDPILRLSESDNEADLLQIISLSQNVERFKKFGFNVDEYWQRIETIFHTTESDEVKKQAVYALVLHKQKIGLLFRENFSPELWQQLLGEIPQWGNSSNQIRKDAWLSISKFQFNIFDRSVDEILAYLKYPWVNANEKNGMTALTLASKSGYSDVVDLLLKIPGVDVNLRDSHIDTALIHASKSGYKDVVALLLKSPGIDINMKGSTGMTALMTALNGRHIEVVAMLLDGPGLDVNAKDQYGMTALLQASKFGYGDAVDLLLQSPAIDVNAKDQYGRTALMWTSTNGHIDIVELLLEVPGIDVNTKDKNGLTASGLPFPIINGLRIRELLLNHGAKE